MFENKTRGNVKPEPQPGERRPSNPPPPGRVADAEMAHRLTLAGEFLHLLRDIRDDLQIRAQVADSETVELSASIYARLCDAVDPFETDRPDAWIPEDLISPFIRDSGFSDFVLVYCGGLNMKTARMHDGRFYDPIVRRVRGVTHWRPLLELPKQHT